MKSFGLDDFSTTPTLSGDCFIFLTFDAKQLDYLMDRTIGCIFYTLSVLTRTKAPPSIIIIRIALIIISVSLIKSWLLCWGSLNLVPFLCQLTLPPLLCRLRSGLGIQYIIPPSEAA